LFHPLKANVRQGLGRRGPIELKPILRVIHYLRHRHLGITVYSQRSPTVMAGGSQAINPSTILLRPGRPKPREGFLFPELSSTGQPNGKFHEAIVCVNSTM